MPFRYIPMLFIILTQQISNQTSQIPSMQVIKSNNAIFGINREYIAIMLVAVGSILSTTGYIYANEGKYHPFTTVTVRGLVALVITYLISLRQKQDLTYSDAENFKWNLLSSFIFLITTYIYAWCQFYLPLPIAITLQATSPIFVALYDKFLNGVELNKAQTFWLTVTFIGALLTANGNQISAFFFSKSTQSSSTFGNYLSDDPMVVLWVSIVLLLVMVLYSYGLILIKKLKNCSSLQLLYLQNMTYLFATALLLPVGLQDKSYNKPDLLEIVKLATFTAIPLTLGMLANNQALLMSQNYALLTPFTFSSIIAGYMVSVFRYGQEANIFCVMGAISIVVGVVFMMRNKAE